VAFKYDPLRRALDAAPPDEPVSFTFAELDELVGGLPPGAWRDRTWWGNTFNRTRSQAVAWMTTGRRVVELQIGKAVVFSPADAPTSGPPGTGSPQSTRTHASLPILDGITALTDTLSRARYGSVTEAVAAHTVFLHPDTVAQTEGKALFRLVRDPTRRGVVGELEDGTAVMFDDNTGPTLAFLWAAQRTKGRDVQFNHVWGDPRNVDTYTALWNLCATPAFLAKTTDGSNHPEVVRLLRYRALDLYGYIPRGEERPSRPDVYASLEWKVMPEPVSNLEGTLRRRLADAPKSRPALCARQLGWLFGAGPHGVVDPGTLPTRGQMS
jgi:hypothetical protein